MKTSPFNRRQFLTIAGAAAASMAVSKHLLADDPAAPAAPATPPPPPKPRKPLIRVGDFKKIYDPSDGEKEKWYINDHTFIRADDGTWHLFGITHKEPANPEDERVFAHATAPDLLGPWAKQPSILPYDPKAGETHVWAPYVLKDGDTYYMFYCGGGPAHDKYRIHLATSKDLNTWERSHANPLVVDGYDARDPMVLKVDDKWVLYYCATSAPLGGNHNVKAVTSTDLLHWGNPQEVFSHPDKGTMGGPTESPFVVAKDGKYYLFLCTNFGYDQSAAYQSDSAFHWEFSDEVGKYPAHASEVIQTPDGKWYVSRAGWGKGGVYLAELTWLV